MNKSDKQLLQFERELSYKTIKRLEMGVSFLTDVLVDGITETYARKDDWLNIAISIAMKYGNKESASMDDLKEFVKLRNKK